MNQRSRIDADVEVQAIARGLGIAPRPGLADAIRDATVLKVQSILHRLKIEPKSLSELREVVHHATGLQVVRIETDEQLETAQKRYATELPALPTQLAFEFAKETEALVVRRPQKDRLSNNKFIALVDARGERSARAWFSEWHEATHTLVPDPANNLVLRRTRVERPEPVEQVIDLAASSIGFWAPIVEPAFRLQLVGSADVLAALEGTRVQVASDASRASAYRALSNHSAIPAIILWVDYDCRAADSRPGGNPANSYALRAKVVIRNNAAIERGLDVPLNFRIPTDSIIARAVNLTWATPLAERDDLRRWKDSRGRALRPGPVKITARGRWAAIEAAG